MSETPLLPIPEQSWEKIALSQLALTNLMDDFSFHTFMVTRYQ